MKLLAGIIIGVPIGMGAFLVWLRWYLKDMFR